AARLWNEKDGFYYDVLHLPDSESFPMKVRSMVGLIPLFAVETLEPDIVDKLPGFKRRLEWFIATGRISRVTSLACGPQVRASADCSQSWTRTNCGASSRYFSTNRSSCPRVEYARFHACTK